jgi:nucleoside-diphosphate-sugar epimerase
VRAESDITRVLGGSGKTGRRVVDRLRARGLPVRVGSRSSEPPVDWEDRSTSPGPPPLTVPQGETRNRTAQTDGPRRLILLIAAIVCLLGALPLVAEGEDALRESSNPGGPARAVAMASGSGEPRGESRDRAVAFLAAGGLLMVSSTTVILALATTRASR